MSKSLSALEQLPECQPWIIEPLLERDGLQPYNMLGDKEGAELALVAPLGSKGVWAEQPTRGFATLRLGEYVVEMASEPREIRRLYARALARLTWKGADSSITASVYGGAS